VKASVTFEPALKSDIPIDPSQIEVRKWLETGCKMPAPNTVKWQVLSRYSIPKGIWIETGTFRGETTDFLAQTSARIYSLEPDGALFQAAKKRFSARENVHILNHTSESGLELILEKEQGNLNVFLDGHHSGLGTFRGENDTPVLLELALLKKYLNKFASITVIIDDVRLFNGNLHVYGCYPHRNALVDFARENGFDWSIEIDMFIMCRWLKPIECSVLSSV
jgi:hypothetical protein